VSATILGLDGPAQEFLSAMRGERPHHGWLFVGTEGLGKATLARQLAARALAEAAGLSPDTPGVDVPEDYPTARYMAGHAHPDFMSLERMPRDDKLLNKPRSEWPDKVELARSIRVDQVRALTSKFATKSSLSERRIVLIDAADDLETASANALLKSLEEPPAGTIFILISHAPGRLLPTIRSRCRVLRFSRLEDAVLRQALAAALPDAGTEEIASLAQLSGGAPGQGLRHAGLNLSDLSRDIDAILSQGDASLSGRIALAQALAFKASQERYEAFLRLVPARLAEAARNRTGEAMASTIKAWEQASALAAMAIPGSYDPYAIVMEMCGLMAALAPRAGAAKA